MILCHYAHDHPPPDGSPAVFGRAKCRPASAYLDGGLVEGMVACMWLVSELLL